MSFRHRLLDLIGRTGLSGRVDTVRRLMGASRGVPSGQAIAGALIATVAEGDIRRDCDPRPDSLECV